MEQGVSRAETEDSGDPGLTVDAVFLTRAHVGEALDCPGGRP